MLPILGQKNEVDIFTKKNPAQNLIFVLVDMTIYTVLTMGNVYCLNMKLRHLCRRVAKSTLYSSILRRQRSILQTRACCFDDVGAVFVLWRLFSLNLVNVQLPVAMFGGGLLITCDKSSYALLCY